MRKRVRPSFVAVLFILSGVVMGLVGCGDSAQPVATQPTATVAPAGSLGAIQDTMPTTERQGAGNFVPPTGIEIVEVPETGAYRDAIIKGLGDVTWVDPGQGEAVTNQSAKDIALEAIRSEGNNLAEVDYVALALPDFKDVTRKLELSGADFQGGDVELEAIGRVNDAHRYLLFSYTGKEIPQLRPQVFRWVQTYALYDNTTTTVIRLVATIRGEAHE